MERKEEWSYGRNICSKDGESVEQREKRRKDGKKSRPSAFMELNSLPLSFNWPRLIDPPF